MPLGSLPPWVRGVDAEAGISSGASAGLGVARLQQEQQSDAARQGMEAMRLKQAAGLEQARLQQAAEQSQMEFQARQEVAKQQQLRQQQAMNIDAAYKTATLGLAQGRLEEVQKAADEKARNAALQFQREQGFARDVAAGVPVMEAYQRNPVAASVLSAVGRTQLKEGTEAKPLIREGKFPLIEYDPKTGTTRQVYTPPAPVGLSKSDTEDLKDLRHERDLLTKGMGDRLMNQISPMKPEEQKAQQDKLNEINQRIEAIKRPKLQPPPTNSTDKITRAHALGIAHPDWTKEQIIDAVMKEMQ
jgi:hypothetical protein